MPQRLWAGAAGGTVRHRGIGSKPSAQQPRVEARQQAQQRRASVLAAAATAEPPLPPPDAASLPNWCSGAPYALPPGTQPYTTMTRTNKAYKIYSNAYWHAQKWYAVLPPAEMANRTLEEGLSVNTALIRLPATDADAFTDNLAIGYLPGTTLLIDFPFPAFPDNNGHWAEIMLPTYSVLANASWMASLHGRSRFVDRVLLSNMRKVPRRRRGRRSNMWRVGGGGAGRGRLRQGGQEGTGDGIAPCTAYPPPALDAHHPCHTRTHIQHTPPPSLTHTCTHAHIRARTHTHTQYAIYICLLPGGQ